MRNYYKTPLTLLLILLISLYLPSCKSNHPAEKSIEKDAIPISDQEIVDAYTYLYGRYLVIQQENHDINTERVGYNKIKYNPLGSAQFVNPNLDVAYLESWIAVDSTHAVILNIPKIENRYYTAELLDGWGEVITNINERNFPKTPYGKFALYIKGTNPPIPSDAVKIELPSAKIKMLARVELKGTPAIAKKLQEQFTLTVPDSIRIDSPVNIPEFTPQKLIGGTIFDKVEEVLASCPDKMPKAKDLQATAEKAGIYNSSGPNEKRRINSIVVAKAIPAFLTGAKGFGSQKGGWSVSYVAGHFGDDMMARDIINYGGLWANVIREAIYFVGLTDSGKEPLSGDNGYEIRFSKDSLPGAMVNAFWSVTLYSVPDYRLVKNPIKRYNINNLSGLKNNDDGSVSIWLASKMPKDIPQTNWLPTPKGKGFSLTFRMYVSKDPVLQGKWFPAAIHKVK
jgi:hypothetical protein